MKKNQQLKNKDGYEVFLFPMDVMSITQGYNDKGYWLSHEGTKAIDIVGTRHNYPLFMPCTGKCIGKYDLGNGNGVLWESVDKVLLANGKLDYVHWVFWHDTNISDFAVDSVWKQGDECQDTGISGIGSGDHCHFEVGIGKAPKSGYPLKNTGHTTHFSQGKQIPTYSLKNAIRPEDAFFINDTIIKNTMGMNFKIFSEEKVMKDGWKYDEKLKGQTYYKNEKMLKNTWVWDSENQAWYWLKDDGIMARNMLIIDKGKTYAVEESGKMIKNKKLVFDNSGVCTITNISISK